MNPSDLAIAVEHLTVSYDRISVLWDIHFSVPTGKMVAIVGPNGAGKSTFLKTILGLIKPLTGKIKILGSDKKSQLQKIAYIPQRESIDWDFPITVEELVLQGLYPKLGFFKFIKKEDRKAAKKALERVNMARYANRQINQLSVGQKQRVFLARALLQQAEIYFLDEPFSGVDSITSQVIFSFLKDLREKGKSIFVIHHDLKSIQEHFDWIILLNMRLIACGEVSSELTTDNLKKTYGQSTNIFEETFTLSQDRIAGVKPS